MPDLTYLRPFDPARFNIRGQQPVMEAVVTTGNGGYERLDYRDVPIPVPGAGEVFLRVLAAGVNNTEINTRLGWYSSSVQGGTEQLSETNDAPEIEDGGWSASTPFPFIRGTDCCGEVVAWGQGTKGPDIGKRVLVRACMRLNGFDSLDNLWMGSDQRSSSWPSAGVPMSSP